LRYSFVWTVAQVLAPGERDGKDDGKEWAHFSTSFLAGMMLRFPEKANFWRYKKT
jgi:hypothetical protein